MKEMKVIRSLKLCFCFQALDESASLLSVTCDTFLQTLEECIKLGRDVSTPQPFLVPHSPVVESFAGVPPFHSKKVFQIIFWFIFDLVKKKSAGTGIELHPLLECLSGSYKSNQKMPKKILCPL